MNKIIVLLFISTIGFISCKKAKKETDKIKIAKEFYRALNNSNSFSAKELISKHFATIDDGFEQKYNENDYAEWVKWDSVFQPTYKILEIKNENGTVKALISKIDKRISFLHDKPIITNEIIQFDDNKITNINRTSASFNVVKFVKKRDELVIWIAKNHPELNGFLHDQTKSGGMNYLKAIELYKNKK